MSKAMNELVGGASTGSAECRKHWTTALILWISGQDRHPSNAERAHATQEAWDGGRYRTACSAMREQGSSKTGIAWLPHVKVAPMSAPRPQVRALQNPNILTVKWVAGGIPEESRFLTQLTFLKKEKDSTANIFDDDEWIRSLTEAQEITEDIREERITSTKVKLTLERCDPSRWCGFCENMSPGDSFRSVTKKSQPHSRNATTRC